MPSRRFSVSDVLAAVLAHRCPYCSAAPGEPCTTRSGLATALSHASRYYAAADAGDLPPVDDKPIDGRKS